jgi:hypothetical protein
VARDENVENRATSPEHLLSPRFAPENIVARLERAFELPVCDLNEWVLKIRDDPRLPEGGGRTIPFFDPRGGGVEARVLFLMQDPSEVATFTGFISPDNNDRTANNSTIACDAAGLESHDRVHWNIFPWWVNVVKKGRPVDPTRPPQTYAAARPLAATLLVDLVDKLDGLVVIVLLGNEARAGYDKMASRQDIARRGIEVRRCPSCSPQSWNNVDNSDPQGRRRSEIVVETLVEAADLIGR